MTLYDVTVPLRTGMPVFEGDPPPHRESTDEDRVRFLGVAGLLLAGLSAVAIVYTALPVFAIGDCR